MMHFPSLEITNNANQIQPSSFESGADMRVRELLILLERLAAYVVNDGVDVHPKTIQAAYHLLQKIPAQKELPKINIDDDGNVVMAWFSTSGLIDVALSIDREKMYWVVRPGANSIHKEPSIYAGYIPPDILSEMPRRAVFGWSIPNIGH